MRGRPSYYAPEVAEERLRPMAEKIAALYGGGEDNYNMALSGIRGVISFGTETRTIPRYSRTIDGKHIRLWGKPIIQKGGKP